MTDDMDAHRSPLRRRRSPRAGTPAIAPRSGRLPHPARRIVIGVLVGALTMFAVATLDTFAGARCRCSARSPRCRPRRTSPAVVEVPAPPRSPGTCLNWTRPDAADTAVVDCGQPHLFEQAGLGPCSPTRPRCPTTSSGASW